MLHTGVGLNSVSLSVILGDLIVNELDDIKSDGSLADGGEVNLADDLGSVGDVEDSNSGSS